MSEWGGRGWGVGVEEVGLGRMELGRGEDRVFLSMS